MSNERYDYYVRLNNEAPAELVDGDILPDADPNDRGLVTIQRTDVDGVDANWNQDFDRIIYCGRQAANDEIKWSRVLNDTGFQQINGGLWIYLAQDVTVLTNNITAVQTSIVVNDASRIKVSPSTFTYIAIGGINAIGGDVELMLVTAVNTSTNTLTVTRLSGAMARSAGDAVWLLNSPGFAIGNKNSLGFFTTALNVSNYDVEVGVPLNVSDDVTILGSGPSNGNLSVGRNLTVTGDTTLNGNSTVGSDSTDTMTVNATSTFNNNLTIGSDSTDTLTVRSTSTFNNDLNVGIDATDTMTVKSTSSFENGVTLGSSSADTLTINSAITSTNHRIIELYSSSDTGGSTINTTAAETLFANHVIAVPAAAISRGEHVHFRAWGTYGITGTPTLTIRLRCGASPVGTGSTLLMNFGAAALSAAGIWILDAMMRYGSSGSTTSQYWTGTLMFGANNGAMTTTRMVNDATVLSLGSAREFGLTAQWSVSSASNTITWDRYIWSSSTI